MDILKILVRTFVLFVCSVVQAIGILAEGLYRLLTRLNEYLVALDDKLTRGPVKKKDKKTDVKPTEG